MKKRIVKILVVSLVLLMGLAFIVAQGQGPVDEPAGGDVGAQGEIGTMDVVDGPVTGYKVLYMFTGVQRDSTSSPTISTRVYCTNYDTGNGVNVIVQFFKAAGQYGAPLSKSIGPGYTEVFSLEEGVLYGTFSTPNGFGWVTVPDGIDTKVICTAQVYHTASPPSFIARLQLYDENGNLMDGNKGDSGTGGIYLPLIMKNN